MRFQMYPFNGRYDFKLIPYDPTDTTQFNINNKKHCITMFTCVVKNCATFLEVEDAFTKLRKLEGHSDALIKIRSIIVGNDGDLTPLTSYISETQIIDFHAITEKEIVYKFKQTDIAFVSKLAMALNMICLRYEPINIKFVPEAPDRSRLMNLACKFLPSYISQPQGILIEGNESALSIINANPDLISAYKAFDILEFAMTCKSFYNAIFIKSFESSSPSRFPLPQEVLLKIFTILIKDFIPEQYNLSIDLYYRSQLKWVKFQRLKNHNKYHNTFKDLILPISSSHSTILSSDFIRGSTTPIYRDEFFKKYCINYLKYSAKLIATYSLSCMWTGFMHSSYHKTAQNFNWLIECVLFQLLFDTWIANAQIKFGTFRVRDINVPIPLIKSDASAFGTLSILYIYSIFRNSTAINNSTLFNTCYSFIASSGILSAALSPSLTLLDARSPMIMHLKSKEDMNFLSTNAETYLGKGILTIYADSVRYWIMNKIGSECYKVTYNALRGIGV